MLDQAQITRIKPKLMLIQVVALALILGAMAFAAVSSVIVDWENRNDQIKMLTLFAMTSGLFIFAMSIFIPKFFATNHTAGQHSTRESVSDKSVDAIVPMLMTETVIRYALIEGGVFLNLMVLIIEPHLATAVVAGIGLVLMLAMFPRQSKLISILEFRLRDHS